MMMPSTSSYSDPYKRPMDGSSYSPYGYQAPVGSFEMGQMPTYGNSMPTAPYLNGGGHPSSSYSHPSSGYGLPSTSVLGSKQQKEACAEEEGGCLDEDKFGAENKAPSEEWTICGIDLRPVLPVALSVSTVVGAICMLLVQIPMLSRLTGLSEAGTSAVFGVIYGVTLGCMTYCAFADPGQVRKARPPVQANTYQQQQMLDEEMPRRAHKCWLYQRPVRRYDHYCKWLQNVIGLLNHREFLLMVLGLLFISVSGIAVDVWLAILIAKKGFLDTEIIVLLHLAYSIVLLWVAGPICKIHVGLVSRNETAQDWKNNIFYIANNTKQGNNVPVGELDVDEFNALFETFVYDPRRNPWDNGCPSNCCSFWCNARWPKGERGEW